MIMEALKTLLSAPLLHFIHKDFHRALANMTLIDRFFFLVKPQTPPPNFIT